MTNCSFEDAATGHDSVYELLGPEELAAMPIEPRIRPKLAGKRIERRTCRRCDAHAIRVSNEAGRVQVGHWPTSCAGERS